MALADGALLDLRTGRWHSVATRGAPSPRYSPSVVLSGQRVVIWGGQAHSGRVENGKVISGLLADGGVYDLRHDRWTPIPAAGAPTLLDPNPAVAIVGDHLVVVGSQAAAFNLRDNVWLPLAQAPRLVLGQAVLSYAIDTERLLLVDTSAPFAIHLVDLAARTFVDTQLPPELRGLSGISTLWTGRRLFVLGGYATGSNGCDQPNREMRPCDPHPAPIVRWNMGWVFVP